MNWNNPTGGDWVFGWAFAIGFGIFAVLAICGLLHFLIWYFT